uniref:Uncharacterized protein n=1 Tax=Panagrolaimus davidi TaxID=227884 RepID=A0A914QTU2_9BILA
MFKSIELLIFAFGGVFRDLVDSAAEAFESCPIPLLFVIVLQRRYSVRNRRQACTWIRRQMPIIFAEFSLKERMELPYPINAIQHAYNMDPDGFKSINALHTESGMEEEATQDSKTRPSEKNGKKKSGGGKKKKRSKKRH